MRVTKIFQDGHLVSYKSQECPPDHMSHEKSVTALKNQFVHGMESFVFSITQLRKKLKHANKLIAARTRERNSAREAHRRRLRQVGVLRARLDDLKLELLILKEDMSSMDSSKVDEIQPIEAPVCTAEYPFGIKATAVKKG